MKTYTYIVACMIALGAVSATAVDKAEQMAEEVTFEQKLNSVVPLDLQFRDDAGQLVELQSYFGDKPVLLSLVYYECPMLCTLTLNGMLDCFKELPFEIGKDFEVVTVSFDHEETHVLASKKKDAYIKELDYEAAAGWHFLVGEEESVKALTRSVGFGYQYDPETDEFAHRSGILLITPEGKISHYFAGVQFDPRDVRFGLIEASDNKIGSAVDKLFLMCYHYDPTVGKYGLIIQNVINIGCGLTVAVLGVSLFVMLRGERRQRHAGAISSGASS